MIMKSVLLPYIIPNTEKPSLKWSIVAQRKANGQGKV